MSSGTSDKRTRWQDDEIILLPQGEAHLGRALMHALRNAGISVLYQDRDLKAVWARNMRAPWDDPDTGASMLPPAQAERLESARRNVILTGSSEHFEVNVTANGITRWFEVWVDADRDDTGVVKGVVTTKVEITDHKYREQTLRMLLREVSHRSKNLLAIIQSIASQTGRYSDTIADFLTRFRGRLQSLASSQDLVTSSNWRGAALHELIANQVSRYGADLTRTLRFSGDNPYLSPNAALHIGLAIHELTVNSISYGALSRHDGFVDVSASLATVNGNDVTLLLVWIEPLSAQTRPQAEKRFGSVTLERVVPAALNGTASLEMTADRLQYTLVVPRSNFESE